MKSHINTKRKQQLLPMYLTFFENNFINLRIRSNNLMMTQIAQNIVFFSLQQKFSSQQLQLIR